MFNLIDIISKKIFRNDVRESLVWKLYSKIYKYVLFSTKKLINKQQIVIFLVRWVFTSSFTAKKLKRVEIIYVSNRYNLSDDSWNISNIDSDENAKILLSFQAAVETENLKCVKLDRSSINFIVFLGLFLILIG